MYNPKNSTPHRPGRQPSSRKALFALVSILVLVFAAAGVTVAYLQTQTPPLKNEFTPAQVSCEVERTRLTVPSNAASPFGTQETATHSSA